jgi:hypothetical protein
LRGDHAQNRESPFSPHDVIGRAATALAPLRDWPYLKGMAQPVPARQEMIATIRPQSRLGSIIVWGAAGLGGVIVLGAVALWVHYGTAVFFEMIAAGIAACF